MAMMRGSLRCGGIARIDDHLIQGREKASLPPSRALPAWALRAVVALGVGVAAAARLAGVRRVVVEGTSMLPTLAPGDRLVLVRSGRPAPGDLVAVPDPRDRTRLLVKRVAALDGDRVELRGDNPAQSTDSRSFGAVAVSELRGRVVRRYAPPGRRGQVG
jgi:nickel-type superoxide dismutase maturation protease